MKNGGKKCDGIHSAPYDLFNSQAHGFLYFAPSSLADNTTRRILSAAPQRVRLDRIGCTPG